MEQTLSSVGLFELNRERFLGSGRRKERKASSKLSELYRFHLWEWFDEPLKRAKAKHNAFCEKVQQESV